MDFWQRVRNRFKRGNKKPEKPKSYGTVCSKCNGAAGLFILNHADGKFYHDNCNKWKL